VKYLFVHQNFPGQYLHIIRHLLKDEDNEIVFISEPNNNGMTGVRRVNYLLPKVDNDSTHMTGREYNIAAHRAEVVATVAANLKTLGFTPDIIIGHHGWGELLNLPDVWPGVPIIGYFEFYYSPQGQDVGYDAEFPVAETQFPRIRSMNIVNLLALALNQHGQTPTRWQHSRYPEWAQSRIRLLPEGARLDVCCPDPKARSRDFSLGNFTVTPSDRLVTYVVRNLEPYRGFHVIMRALPELLSARPDVKVIMVGGDDVSYGARLPSGTWRERLQKELAGTYDESRVLLPGQVPYPTYLQLLQRSDTHIYLTYPFVPSWSLREAMAVGCAIVAADVEPVREFITHRRTGLLIPGLAPKQLSQTILELLEDSKLNRRLRQGARSHAEEHLDMAAHIAAYEAVIAELTGEKAVRRVKKAQSALARAVDSVKPATRTPLRAVKAMA
jgi:glycosyltransferase involved in cell wall biosynthesis